MIVRNGCICGNVNSILEDRIFTVHRRIEFRSIKRLGCPGYCNIFMGGEAVMDNSILIGVRELLMDAAKHNSEEEIWSIYFKLINDKGNDWQTLVAISIVSSDLVGINGHGRNDKLFDTFAAMNDIVFDHARLNAEEISDYRMFKEHAHYWIDDFR